MIWIHASDPSRKWEQKDSNTARYEPETMIAGAKTKRRDLGGITEPYQDGEASKKEEARQEIVGPCIPNSSFLLFKSITEMLNEEFLISPKDL